MFLCLLILFVRELQREEGPRYGLFIACGIITGFATLIRGNTQFIIIVCAPFTAWILFRMGQAHWLRKTLLLSILFFLAQSIVMAPWSLLQKQSQQDGLMPFGAVYRAYFKGVTRHPGNTVSDWVSNHYKEPERTMKGVFVFNWHWLKKDSKALAELYALKYLRAWYMSDTGRWDTMTIILHTPLWFFGLLGLFVWLYKSPLDPTFAFSMLTIFYMWSISAAMDGISRYSSPLYVFVGIFVGVFLHVFCIKPKAPVEV